MSKNKIYRKYYMIMIPLLLVLVTLSVCVYYNMVAKQRTERQTYETVMSSAQAQIKTLNAVIDGRFTTLEAYARIFALDDDFDFDSPRTMARLGEVRDGDYTFYISLVDADGVSYAWNGITADVSDRSYFTGCMAGQRVIEELASARFSGDPRFILGVPLERDGEIIGVVTGAFAVEAFRDLLIAETYDRQTFSFICDHDGDIVVASEHPLFSLAANIFDIINHNTIINGASGEELLDDIRKGADGHITYTYDDNSRFAVYCSTGINDWIIFNVMPGDVISEAVYNETRVSNAITLLIALLSLVMLFLVFFIQRRSAAELEQERMDFRAAATQSGRMVWNYDLKEDRLFSTYQEEGFLWHPRPAGMIKAGNVAPESVGDYQELFAAIQRGEPGGGVNLRFKKKDGEFYWYHAEYSLMHDPQGNPHHAVITIFDNSEAMEKELAYELWHSELIELKENCLYYLEANLITGAVEEIHGDAFYQTSEDSSDSFNLYTFIAWQARNNIYPDDAMYFWEFFDKNRLIALHAMGVFEDCLDFRATFQGKLIWSRVNIRMVKYPYTEEIKIYAVFNDVEEEHKEKEQLLDRATCDSLTGLLNRDATMKEIEKYLLTQGNRGTHALFMIDIDNFKQVNDTMGHQMGDKVLTSLAASIRASFRESDIVGKIGGDEFFAFMKGLENPAVVLAKAQELLTQLQHIYASGNKRIELSASIGIALYHGDAMPIKSLNTLYAEADAALYKAKALGKNCFAFANEMDALATSTSAKCQPIQGILGLNLSSLLNNLGGGIEIYHGDANGHLIPHFCNKSLLDLLGGLSEEEFMDIYGKDAFAGVHPEDRDSLQEMFDAALLSNSQFQHTCRMKGKAGRYYWVMVTSNFVKHEDGAFDVYAVYTDAEQMIREREERDAKYNAFHSYRLVTAENTAATFRLNLTADYCKDGVSSFPALLESQAAGTVEGFFDSLCAGIDSEQLLEEYRAVFTRENLIARFRQGETSLSKDILFTIEQDRVMWLRLTVEMAENPANLDIEAVVYFLDIDREIRLQNMMSHMIEMDYEFLGQIDVKTGRLIILGGNTDNEIEHMNQDDVDYCAGLPETLRRMIRDEFYDDSLDALNLERMVSELEKADTYVCTFPTKEQGAMKEGFRQWRCSYIDGHKSIIMISRVDVTSALGGETDTLTGLYNQQGFYRHVREELDARPDTKFRLLRFDIDNFKVLNETLGFAMGDQLLRDFGTMLRRRVARFNGDVIFGRLEADHFVSFRPDNGPDAETLMSELSRWLESYPIDYMVMSHMGVYPIEKPELDVSAMCDRALLALKLVKGSFSQRVGYYDNSLRDKLVEEQELSAEMGKALAAGQFEVYFQPQINYEDGSLIGAEALVRWNHPEKGLISPNVFIPLFENNGFITDLDEYIWGKSCGYVRKWMDDDETFLPVPVSVNISRIDIYNRELTNILKTITEKYRLPASMLKLEITESAYMQNPAQLMKAVEELQAEGFTIEMDDFGSGWSSLNTLKDVPVDILKLDLKFLSKGLDDERGGNILSSVIRMAHWLKIPIIAEGVETKEQADYLKSLGCFYMQGYYFARPMPAAQFEELLMKSRLGTTDRYKCIDVDGVAAFWDPSAQTTLLFNSFVGGAAIMEYQDGKAEILRANDKFYQEINTTRLDYLPKQLDTLGRFGGSNRVIFQGMLEEAIRTGAETECEVQVLPQREGEPPFWTHNRVRLLARNSDRCLFYLATENITERREMEEQLRISKDALRLSISYTGRVVCSYEVATHELTLPEEYARRYGLPTLVRDLHLGPNRAIPEDQEKFKSLFERIHNGESSGSVIVRAIVPGEPAYAWEQMDFVTVFDGEGAPVRAIITCEDVTAKKEQEAEIIRNNVIIEHTGICVIDYNVITDTMHFKSRLKGKEPIQFEYIGYHTSYLNTDQSVIHPADKAGFRNFFRRLIDDQPESGSYEIRTTIWGEDYAWSRIYYVSMGDDSGRVYRIVGQVSNIQKEKDDAEIIAKLNRALDIQGETYRYNATMAERVFTLLYGSNATEDAINRLLAVLGEYYDLSRVYIIEEDAGGASCTNTFEWCAPGITQEMGNLQNMSYEADLGGSIFSSFDEDGVLLCRDISSLPGKQYEIAARQGILSMLQCAFMDDGVPVGCIAFDECREYRDWTEEEVGTLLLVSRIMGAFLAKLRNREQAEFSADFKMAINDDSSYVYIVDPDTYEIQYTNKAVRSLLGYSCEGAVCYREFIDRDEPCEECPIRIHQETGEVCAVEVERKDGMLVMTKASPLRWDGMNMYMISCIDISAHQQLRDQLSRKAMALQNLYDMMPCGILQYSLQGKNKYDVTFNEAACRMLGYSDGKSFIEAVVNWTDVEHVHPDDLPMVRANLMRVEEQGGKADYEHRFLRPDGSVLWVYAQLQRMAGDNGTYIMQSLFHDISERKLGEGDSRGRSKGDAL